MASHICVVFLALFLAFEAVRAQPCSDLDTNACALFASAQTDFCNTSPVALSSCMRFCGKCPLTCYDCPLHSVLDPNQCNVTRECDDSQYCMINTLMSKDGHREHIMSCGEKRVCNGYGFGFLVGRRSQGYRDLSLKCCHTDLCNYPGHTTDAPTTVAVTTTTMKPFTSCRRDIVFVVEETSSIGEAHFDEIIHFLSSLTSHLDIGSHGDQVSLLLYNDRPYIQWNLNEYLSTSELLNALTYVPFHNGSSRTDLALKYVREHILQFPQGDRLDAPDVVIVITEGRSNSPTNTAIEAQKLHAAGVKVMSLGVGAVLDHEIVSLASDQKNLALKVTSYSHLKDVLPLILDRIC